MEEKFMRRAVELSAQSVRNGGGPFGAVIVRDGEIVGEEIGRASCRERV